MKNFKKGLIIVTLSIFSIVTWSFVDNEFKIAKGLDIYFNLFKELNYYYVDNVDPEKLIQTSIDGMLESLDPYTTFIPESEMDNFKFQTTGQYGGIGALIRKNGDYTVISEPYENFPAAKGGLKAGDVILEIDGKSVKSKDISGVSEMLKGTPGTEVEVLVNRFGQEKPLKKKLIREKVTIPNVPYYGIIRDSIGYIRLTSFTTDAGKDVGMALTELQKRNAKGVIFDLRGNPGGLLIEAVNVANNFLNKNQLVVFTKGKVKDSYKRYLTQNDAIDTIIPMITLVNRGSASASEIVAGSLQDLDRSVILGQRTFGKGLVQQTRPLSYNTQLKVTTAKYYIPSGRCIQALDYTHRNEDGSVGYIPDSLIKEFKTNNGRTVKDGGGIMPDIKITPEKVSDIAFNLYTKNFIFDFATQYSLTHDSILIPRIFTIDDHIYGDFIKFLDGKDFDYKTKTEEDFKTLLETAKKEKYYKQAEEEFKKLKEKLSHDRNKDLENFRPEISEFLTEEIVTRYYYQKGKIEASLITDPEVQKAIDLLKDSKTYSSILNGTYSDTIKDEKSTYEKTNASLKDN